MDELKYTTIFLLFISPSIYTANLSFINQQRVNSVLSQLHTINDANLNKKVEFISNKLANSPYIFSKGANQPIYRFDGFDCQTLVQSVLAFLHANSLTEFNNNYLKIAYGATFHKPNPNFFNRNHFVETDLNPVNRKNGWLRDVTSKNSYAEWISAKIDRQNWLGKQGFQFNFPKQPVSLSYIPKTRLIGLNAGYFTPNKQLLNTIPTPSVIEIVNDPQKWIYHGKPIKQAIGSELIISHMGLLYRKTFHYGQTIYQHITCNLNWRHKKSCQVNPIICRKKSCDELMLAHATSEYPSNFYWYQDNNQFYCSPKKPVNHSFGKCNRVEQLPLSAYLMNYHYGSYWNMNNNALLGIHIEEIL